MANSIYAKPRWKSFDQLGANLNELVAKVEREGMRSAVRKAATPMLQQARANAPVRTGTLRESLKVKVKTFKRGKDSTVMAIIGPDRKARSEAGDRPVKYAHLVELGTVNAPAHPFLRPAFDSTKEQSTQIYADNLKPAIQRIAARVNKRIPI